MASIQATADDENPSKRAKTKSIALEDYISSDILAKQQQQQQEEDEFRRALPYPHVVLPHVFRNDFLRSVLSEIKTNSKVNFKESDLFRVYQSIDLANLDDTENSMSHVMKLRQLLYSDEWRTLVERLLRLPPNTLSNQVDCACNCHIAGCHLLCHDDVIGTRKVSYILYLTEDDWTMDEGGALELYDHENNLPSSIPTATLLPLFNHMAMFVVEPGVSFHAVQEVMGDRPRLSLQGWYHADQAPDNVQAATLQRLKAREDTTETTNFTPCIYPTPQQQTSEVQLSDSDRAYLSQYLHETYLTPEAMQEIRERFEQDSSVQLRNLLCEPWATRLKVATARADDDRVPIQHKDYYSQGCSESWKLVGPAHKQRFLEYTGTTDSTATSDSLQTAGELLQHIRTQVLESVPFWRFLKLVTSLRPTGSCGHVRRFRRGLDYTVAHYGLLLQTSVLDMTLCFVAGQGTQVVVPDDEEAQLDANAPEPDPADMAWQSGDCGGFEAYIAADDEEDDDKQEAADEYNADDDTELLSVSASFNTLSLVYRDPGTMRFVKYVGSSAPSSRFDIAMEYQVEEQEMLSDDDKDAHEAQDGDGPGEDDA